MTLPTFSEFGIKKINKRLLTGLFLALLLQSCAQNDDRSPVPTPPTSPVEKKSNDEPEDDSKFLRLTVLQTNDIHGAVEPVKKDGKEIGGMPFFSGAVHAIRKAVKDQYGKRGGVLVLDAGDQFQGTLISNYNEGELVWDMMDRVSYDAIVPGNHDYDFGPHGWLEDKVTPETEDQNPRGVLENLIESHFTPVISANTYLKTSVPKKGRSWKKALRPEFVKPYLLKKIAGVRVAIIGLDNEGTPTTTTAENVEDLYFRDAFDTYREIYKLLRTKADVFILVMHNGNSSNEFEASNLVRKIRSLPGGGVDLVVAGHTHFIHNAEVAGIRVMQSKTALERFGRADLLIDPDTHRVRHDKTKSFAGVRLDDTECDIKATFCNVIDGKIYYDGIEVKKDPWMIERLQEERKKIAPIAERPLGTAQKAITKNRTSENPLANALTDGLKEATGVDVAFLNMGGIRLELPEGVIQYEDLFRTLPFSNHALAIGPMETPKLIALIKRSITTCGGFGALMQSGLKVTYDRDCEAAKGEVDPHAKLVEVVTLDGTVIYKDHETSYGPAFELIESPRTWMVATLDFLAAGGSGFDGFAGTPMVQDFGIFREVLTETWLKKPVTLSGEIDHRWVNRVSVKSPDPDQP